MKNCLLISILLGLLVSGSVQASTDVAGFQRVTGLPADDTASWSDPNRFQNVNLEAFIAEAATVASTSGATLSTEGTFWRPDEFKFVDGVHSRHFILDISS